MRAKKTAKLDNLSKEMWIAVGFIYCAWAVYAPHVTFLITSGEDKAKGRKSKSKHKLDKNGKCNAIDVSVGDLTPYQREIMLTFIRGHLDPRGYDTIMHKVKGGVLHLHCEWDPKEGEILIRR